MARGYPCIVCGEETGGPARCPTHLAEQRAARRHSGYDDPRYRAARARKLGKPCERCRVRPTTSTHHRDGDPWHNDDGNLMGVCDECKPIVDAEMRANRTTVQKLGMRRDPSPWK